MKTNSLFQVMVSRILALLAASMLAFAPGGAQAQAAYRYSQPELDQMLAPIALYPDPLLSQVLMAATYPLEVVDAARWASAHPEFSGDEAVRAAEAEDWDPSVKSLLAFPQVLVRLGENQQWTQSLGDAFLEQQTQVMDTVQALRRRAQAVGSLGADERMSVIESGPNLMLQPFDPQVIYVPSYDPLIVYGSWWWPAFPPVYLRPWPGYYARPSYARGFYWGAPVGVPPRFFFGAMDWRRREIRVAHVNNHVNNTLTAAQRANLRDQAVADRPHTWQHDPDHRRVSGYRGADIQQRLGAASPPPAARTQAPAVDARPFDRGLAARPDARIESHRSDARTAVEARPQTLPPAHTEIRIVGRRTEAQPGLPPPRDLPLARPPNSQRIESGHESRAAGAPAQGGLATWTDSRRGPSPASAAPAEVRSRPEWRPAAQAARPQPAVRIESPRAPEPRMEFRPALGAVRPDAPRMVVERHEPPARHEPPPAAAPRAEIPPSPASAHHESGAKVSARPRANRALLTFTAWDALPPNADDCKARDEAKGCSLGEERNAAGAAFGGNPKGRG